MNYKESRTVIRRVCGLMWDAFGRAERNQFLENVTVEEIAQAVSAIKEAPRGYEYPLDWYKEEVQADALNAIMTLYPEMRTSLEMETTIKNRIAEIEAVRI